MNITLSSNADLGRIPFSRYGTFLCFSNIKGEWAKRKGLEDGLWLRSVHGAGQNEIARLEVFDGQKPVPFEIERSPSVLKLKTDPGTVEICISGSNSIRIRQKGVSLRLDVPIFRNHGVIKEKENQWILNLAGTFRSYRLLSLTGSIEMDAPWETKRCRHIHGTLVTNNKHEGEFVIEQLSWSQEPQSHIKTFDELSSEIQTDFEAFAKPYLSCPEPFIETSIDAAYLNWSSVVPVVGNITRPAMFMSHNWMTNIWAWDHAFNALGAQFSQPDLAWDQLMIFFDHQNPDGQIPDYFNDVSLLTTFVKPPIHGWILSLMMELGGGIPKARIEEAYPKLSLWTQWWLRFRTPDNDGMPVYWHGNDSGWDNGTSFDIPFPVKSPELSSFIILQMEVLSDLASQLGKDEEALSWETQSKELLNQLLNTLWDGESFSVISTATGETATKSDSIFRCLPIILGTRLPQEVRKALIFEIRRHLTQWGIPTEHPDSEKYDGDGYWRGPIWAPPVMMIVDGLRKSGECELARDVAERFCRLCQKSGFAENFNAITGAPQRDPAYTWTSSVFLTLTLNYLHL